MIGEFLLILIGLGAAWYLGYRSQINKGKSTEADFNRDYFIGLNYLLNDEPDGAIDLFISSLELSVKTLESCTALGTLLRRRGKVDRSISVFQEVLAWPQLSVDEIDRVKVELVKSYIGAGLLDRAERLLEELQSANVEIKILALVQGLTVYQSEKDWQKAIETSSELLKICPSSQRQLYQNQSSHFFCEMAQLEVALQHYLSAREYLKKAFQMDRNNVRVSMLLGELEIQSENYKEAIKVLSKVKQQDGDFFSEAFPLLLASYQHSGLEKKIHKFIQENLESQPSSMVLLAIIDYIETKSGKAAANDFLLKRLRETSSLRMLSRALLLASTKGSNENHDKLNDVDDGSLFLFYSILHAYINTQALYKCNNCGFELKSLHWMCPGCSHWGAVKPDHVIPKEVSRKYQESTKKAPGG